MDAKIRLADEATLEKLPWDCYLLRGGLDMSSQEALAGRVGELAKGAFEDRGGWTEVASKQAHPIIVAAHSASPSRPTSCVRACGLRKCSGACGRHVGALEDAPTDLYDLAQSSVARIAALAPGKATCVKFCPTECWALVYGSGDDNCGKMPSHLDRPQGWTLSISCGNAVKFIIGCPPEPGTMYDCYAPHLPLEGQQAPGLSLVLNGGDILLFQGHRVFHAVDGGFSRRVSQATESRWAQNLLEGQSECPPWQPSRLALLFRDQKSR